MKKLRSLQPLMRAVGVVGVVAGLATGVTYAALSSQATLTNNTISSASANLLIWNGRNFKDKAPGFTVKDLVPGQGSSPQAFYLKNSGPVAMDVSAHIPITPAEPEGGYGFTGWENVLVTFRSNEPGCVDNEVNTTMAALLTTDVDLPCNALNAGAQGNAGAPSEGNFTATFDIKPEAISGTRASVGPFDLQFNGVQAIEDSEPTPTPSVTPTPTVTPAPSVTPTPSEDM